jgi:coproporphyrinogen III oxidase-like Fe-S oxidoreductase
LTSLSEKEALKKREKIQNRFWNQVGSVEHISLPKLEDAIRKEFNCKDDRFIQAQIKLMQTEARIRVQSNVKVWIKQPNAEFRS